MEWSEIVSDALEENELIRVDIKNECGNDDRTITVTGVEL